jgi:TRAP-type C4-dicarboxylate transport system substrate-binding protein
VSRAALESCKVGQQAELKLEKTINGTLEGMGVKFTHPDKAPFIQASQKVVDDIAAQRGAEFQELVNQIRNTK